MLRHALVPLGWIYGAGMTLRNALHDRRTPARLGVPVVSIGNLSVGGTGKTPFVVHCVARALAAGKRPGVLARGYGRAPGALLNDEGMLLANRFPGLLQVQDPDRVRGGRTLVARGADWIVLDDGFQHRRLHRDVDIVCLDAARPFDHVLPAGRQREPARGLARADFVVLTRADDLDPDARARLVQRIAHHAGRVLPVATCTHAPSDVLVQPQRMLLPADTLRGRRVVLLSAIARPLAFERTARAVGAEVLEHRVLRDHAALAPALVEALARKAAEWDAALLVTEKDDVKLSNLPVPRLVLRIDLRFADTVPDEVLRLR